MGGNGEISQTEHFLLYPQRFQLYLIIILLFVSDIKTLSDIFENIVTKQEIAQNKQFLPLPQCCQHYSMIILSFTYILFKVVCCICAVCRKALPARRINSLLLQSTFCFFLHR